MIGLHGGLPPPNCFPIAGMELIDSERVDIKVDPDKVLLALHCTDGAAPGFKGCREMPV